MKTPSTDLFQLIKSLTAQEKKYFKQYSRVYSGERDNNYLLLFDAIDQQEEYDEPALKKSFASKAFVKNLGVAKIYLTDKILDALAAMYGESDEFVQIKRKIIHFELLSKRKLMNGALIAYDRAYDFAIETGSLTLLPHIIRQKNLMLSHHEKKFSGKEFIANAETAIEQTRILENFLRYELLSIRCNLLYSDSGLYADPDKMRHLDEIMQDPLMQDQTKVLSFRAWFHFTRMRYRYYLMKGWDAECYTLLREALAYLKTIETPSHQWQITNYHFLVDLIYLCFTLRYLGEIPTLLTQIDGYIKAQYQPVVAMRHTYFTCVLRYHVESGLNIGEGILYWEKQKKWWQKEQHKFEVQTRGTILFNVLQLYFLACDWTNAIKIINDLLNSRLSYSDERTVRFYWLMIQFEIENIQQLHDQALRVRHWLQKSNIVTPQENAILNFFANIHKAMGKKEIETQMRQLLDGLAGDNHKLNKLTTNGNKDVLLWLESKLTKQPFHLILQSKIAQ